MPDTCEGKFKNWNVARGFGFIEREGQRDVFCHIKSLNASGITEPPERGQAVTFEIENKPQGPAAINISLL